MNKLCENHEQVVITRRGEPAVVMLSLTDDKAIEETTYLLHSIVSLNSGCGKPEPLSHALAG